MITRKIKKAAALGPTLTLAKIFQKLANSLESHALTRKIVPEPGKIYKVAVDDVEFEMGFANYQIGRTILERIEGVREPGTTSIIKSVLRPGDRVLELGGCYGYFTMLMVDSVGATGKVISIEGLPNNFAILKSNIERNAQGNVDCHNCFIGANGDTVAFNVSDTSPYRAISEWKRQLEVPSASDNKVQVPCVHLGAFLAEQGFEATHIFMDIEGFDVTAIEQLSERYLEVHSPILVFEHHEHFYAAGRGLAYLRGLLKAKGYTTRRIYDNIMDFKDG